MFKKSFLFRKIHFKKWILILFILLAPSTAFIYTINYLVDPYGTKEIVCKNIFKPVLKERAKKYSYIFKEDNIAKYDSLILGSSRVMQIIPSHIPNAKYYNFGVHVGSNAESLFIIQEWLKKKPLKNVYLGIDLYSFHKLKDPLNANELKFKEQYSHNHLSFDTLKLSIKSLNYQKHNSPQSFFERDGELNYFHDNMKIKEDNYDFSDSKYEQNAKNNYKLNFIDSPFEIEYRVFSILEQIKKLSKIHNFKLYVFITPKHNFAWEIATDNKKLHKDFILIKQNLVDIFGIVYDFTIESPYNKNNKNFYDPYHYTPSLGDKIIQTLQNNGSDYGAILTKESN